jgi:DNA mismatch repair protein MutL
MGRIRILSDNVANKIAAGEVVERPASVVKELLENSLDAGATEIRVDTENAGRRLIQIQDNGHGMMRDDAMLAFERHATSKLSDVKDLLAIETLGFRGEALPSIASVSRLLLETRAEGEQTGTAVEIAGGKLLRCDEIARAAGTTISVHDLFYNMPARKKFLRSDQTELAHVGSLMTHYSLAHCDKRFELFHEGRELLNVAPVAGIRERAFQVFGDGMMDDLLDLGIEATDLRLPPPYVPPNARAHADAVAVEPEFSHFEIRGLASGPHVQKLNRNSVFLFVNGRLIRDKLILHAITAAYHNLMPPGCFPFALVFLSCNPEEVDVNVHPAKTEVRFRHGTFIHDFVRDSIRSVLMKSRPVSNMPLMPASPPAHRESGFSAGPRRVEFPNQPMQNAEVLPFSEFSQLLDEMPSGDALPWPANLTVTRPILPEAELEPGIPKLDSLAPSLKEGIRLDNYAPLPEVHVPAAPIHSPSQGSVGTAEFAPAALVRRIPDTHGALGHLPSGWEQVDNYSQLPDLRPMGQLHDSFIIAAGRDGLWIIDQHVAHERILFERVLRERRAGKPEIQRLLMPIVLKLTPGQEFEYARIAGELNASGFETEPFGQRTLAVKAAPAGVSPSDIERIVLEILEISEDELRNASVDEIRRGVSATIACRAAIKINTRLEPTKIDWMLRALAACDYPMNCPHGRPVALRYSTKDILRSFHRI